MTFPEAVRVHHIVDYWYCSERSRLMACLGLEAPTTERMDEGSEVHAWLERRPKTEGERMLLERLKPFEPFRRTFDETEIDAHPDDMVVLNRNKVQIVEYKTVDEFNLKLWKVVLHKYQLQLYAWVLEPILREAGYKPTHYHTLIYLKPNGVFLKRASVESDNYCTERMIGEVFSFWRKGEPLIHPMKWKCSLCPNTFKIHCRIFSSKTNKKSAGGGDPSPVSLSASPFVRLLNHELV